IAVSILGKIWLVPIRGGEARQLTRGTDWDIRPSFSADGGVLAFGRYREFGSDLVLLDLDTMQSRTLWHDAAPEVGVNRMLRTFNEIKWDPIRDRIFFAGQKNTVQSIDAFSFGLVKAKVEAQGIKTVPDGGFALSNDGKSFVFAANDADGYVIKKA